MDFCPKCEIRLKKDNNGSVREENEIWDHGIVRFSNGAILSHDFSYHLRLKNYFYFSQ